MWDTARVISTCAQMSQISLAQAWTYGPLQSWKMATGVVLSVWRWMRHPWNFGANVQRAATTFTASRGQMGWSSPISWGGNSMWLACLPDMAPAPVHPWRGGWEVGSQYASYIYTPLVAGRYAQNQLMSFLKLTVRCTAPTARHVLRVFSMRLMNNLAVRQNCTTKNNLPSRILNCCNVAAVLHFHSQQS